MSQDPLSPPSTPPRAPYGRSASGQHLHHDHDHDHDHGRDHTGARPLGVGEGDDHRSRHSHSHHHQPDHEHGHSDDHDHGHDHAHGHGHGHGLFSGGHHHHHAPTTFGAAFGAGAALNAGFVIAETIFGVTAHSLALLADAGHNLGDVLALLIAWGASWLARRTPTARYTYGLRSTSILAALFNAAVLLLITGAIAAEAVRRLFDPAGVPGTTVMAVAAAGIVVNGLTAWMFAAGSRGDINVRSAFQHMLADAVVAAGVVVAGAFIVLTGWRLIDPLVSLIVSVLVVAGTWGLLRDSLNMALHAVPPGIEPKAVQSFLEAFDGVAELHDLHIWPMSTTETALTAHLVMPAGHPGDQTLAAICKELKDRFGIGHATIQIEVSVEGECALQPAHVV